MFLDVTLYAPGVVDAAEKVLDAWEKEHDEYYGTPHGMSGYEYGGYGYCDLPDGGRWLTCTGNYHAIQFVAAPRGWLWDVNGITEGVRIIYHGRRHGMRGELARLLERFWNERAKIGHSELRDVHVYLTREPKWLPWETLDDHKIAAES